MLHVIYRDWTEWVEAFSTLAEAQTRFAALKAKNPDCNLQILSNEKCPWNASGGYDVSLPTEARIGCGQR